MKAYALPIICASIIISVAFGIRQTLPLTIDGIISETGLDYLTLSLAFAVGQIVYGFANSLGGMLADEYGDEKALILGILLSFIGCILIPFSSTNTAIIFAIGILSAGGSGIAGISVAMSAVNKRIPKEFSGLAFGVVNAGGSFGQFLLAPLGIWAIVNYGWVAAIYGGCILLLLSIPFAFFLRSGVENKISKDRASNLSMKQMLSLAFKTPSYIFLALGFFVCGFHVAFIATHMPGVIAMCGLPPTVAGWALGIIGIFNIFGSLFAGWFIVRRSMKLLLSFLYLVRALIVVAFLLGPKDEISVLIFAAALGFTYLSTVPPTAALVNKMFGPKFMGTLFGIVLFSHQIGGFLGAYLGGYFFTITGDYTVVWYLDIALALFAAVIHLPIKEKTVQEAFV